MQKQDRMEFMEHLLHQTNHRFGIVYDFVTVCSSMMNISHEFLPGISLTIVEMNAVVQIADHPGITATDLCKKWNRTRGAISQILKKVEEKNLIYRMSRESNDKCKLLYPTETGILLRDRAKKNELEDNTRIFSELLYMNCSPQELEHFYKVIDIYTKIILQHPEMMWNHLMDDPEK